METMFEVYYTATKYQYSRQICLNICEQAYVLVSFHEYFSFIFEKRRTRSVLTSSFYRYSVCNCTAPTFWYARTVLLPNGTVIFAPLCKIVDPCYGVAAKKFTGDLDIITQQCSHCTSECELTSFNVQLSSILVSHILFLCHLLFIDIL